MTSDREYRPNPDVTVGAPVVTRDGERLGEVKELNGPYFKVAASMRPDYWLQQTFARRNADGILVMDFARDELGSYEVKDIDADLQGDALNRTDATLLNESGTSTDTATEP